MNQKIKVTDPVYEYNNTEDAERLYARQLNSWLETAPAMLLTRLAKDLESGKQDLRDVLIKFLEKHNIITVEKE